MKLLIILVGITIVNGCYRQPEIVITRNFLVNGYWDGFSTNFFDVERLKTSGKKIVNRTTGNNRQIDESIINDLETDSAFIFHYISNKEKLSSGDTVYFDKTNEGDWYPYNPIAKTLGTPFKILKQLDTNTWYKFSRLRDQAKYFAYVYIDQSGGTHLFEKNLSNY